jgi:hypothetical protein
MVCLKCGKEHDGSYGCGKYCSSGCAHSHVFSPQSRELKADRLRKFLESHPEAKENMVSRMRDPVVRAKALAQSRKIRKSKYEEELILGDFDTLSLSQQRLRILQEQKGICAICKCPRIWNDKPLSFQLDHISGYRSDNSRTNLRLICPNCYSQTPTFGSKNRKRDVSDDDFLIALLSTDSTNEAICLVGLNPSKSNYLRAHKLLMKHRLWTEPVTN